MCKKVYLAKLIHKDCTLFKLATDVSKLCFVSKAVFKMMSMGGILKYT